MSDLPLVSVLTPVFNGGKFLAACIESVLRQTYAGWEYIIVNNCSTDNTLEIAESYARKDCRLRVVNNKTFLSALENHNCAIMHMSARSKYCKFLHSDDWLYPECLASMVSVAEANPSAGIVGSFALEGKNVRFYGIPYEKKIMSGKEICRESLLGGPYVFGSPTSLLIRSDITRKGKIFFNEDHLHADEEACYEALKENDFGFVHQVLSYSRLHEGRQSSFAAKFNTYITGGLHILMKYGPFYLSPGEYKGMLNRRLREYYIFLVESLFRMREKEFWRFHSGELHKVGLRFSASKFLAAAARVGIGSVARTAKRIMDGPEATRT
jgi:glycosyltransferase involved in cell wall biosynthesis